MKQTLTHKILLTVMVVLPFLSLLFAIYLAWNTYVFATDLILFGVLYTITALGITIGYHRMLTHQGFDCPAWLRGMFLIFGAMALLGSKPESWAATHVKHHAHSDEEGDPHSPLEGFVHAHFGWLYKDDSFGDPKIYTPQLLQDPVVMFVSRYQLLWAFLSFAIPFAIGGWTGLLWGGLVRYFFTTHVTWSVNSVCHTFGKRAFETTDESRNEWVVGLLAFGEGWHNNHHAFPHSAFHGLKWYQFDLSGIIIHLMEKMGLVWNVQRVNEETMAARVRKTEHVIAAHTDLRTQLQQLVEKADLELQAFFKATLETSMDGLEAEAKTWREFHANAVRRVQRIQKFVTKAKHMKKQKQLAYANELQQIVTRIKEEMQRRRLAFATEQA